MIHKRSTALERPCKNILVEGLNRIHDAYLILSSDVDQDIWMFGFHERPLAYQCIISKIENRYKAKIMTQQYIKLNTRAKISNR